MFQAHFVNALQQATAPKARSIAVLEVGKAYIIKEFEKGYSHFHKDQAVIATLLDMNNPDANNEFRIYLPSRVPCSFKTDEEIQQYNSAPMSEKILLFYFGKLGRSHNFQFATQQQIFVIPESQPFM